MDFWRTLPVGSTDYAYLSLAAVDDVMPGAVARLPMSLKILLENVLRHDGGGGQALEAILKALLPATGDAGGQDQDGPEIAFYPSRVLMPDSSGLPLIADLAMLRDAAQERGLDPRAVAPLIPLDLVVDHSLIVDVSGSGDAAEVNLNAEIARNDERYRLVKWAEGTFRGLKVVPPGNGICHQLNLERLAQVVVAKQEGERLTASFETLVGMDSHTPMINAMGVLGWGVGGIEAATAMLGEPIGVSAPRVVGCRLSGCMPKIASTTDLALTVTQRLRQHGVVGAFVEFHGPGVASLTLPQRATLSNMAPEYGATVGLFAIDRETLRYLEMTGRSPQQLALIEAYARAQGVWREEGIADTPFSEIVEIDLDSIELSAAGPSRPHDRVVLGGVRDSFAKLLAKQGGSPAENGARPQTTLRDGDIVIAAITSCTNTSNPSVMMEAGLLARNAVKRGLQRKPWVKASLAPGSRIVADYLSDAGLQPFLDELGFNVVGYGCTTCMGNSGPLAAEVADEIERARLRVCAVLSGNRNFEGRIHNAVTANYLVSPALVVAYSLAGSVTCDLTRDPLGTDSEGRPVFLDELRPSAAELEDYVRQHIGRRTFDTRYANGFHTPAAWNELRVETTPTCSWDPASTYIRKPPFLDLDTDDAGLGEDIHGARALLVLGDTVTTDHISPVSKIKPDSAAGRYLLAQGVGMDKLDSFMSRRANHDVMLRGTFANPHLANEMVPDKRGGFTSHQPEGTVLYVHEAAERYADEGTPLIVIAGAAYGTGSSRDWAAKGTRLLGIRAIVAESFERIHRSNLVGMGVLPLEFPPGTTRSTLSLDGTESYDVTGLSDLGPRQTVRMTIRRTDGSVTEVDLLCRIDSERELTWYESGGILPLALEKIATQMA